MPRTCLALLILVIFWSHKLLTVDDVRVLWNQTMYIHLNLVLNLVLWCVTGSTLHCVGSRINLLIIVRHQGRTDGSMGHIQSFPAAISASIIHIEEIYLCTGTFSPFRPSFALRTFGKTYITRTMSSIDGTTYVYKTLVLSPDPHLGISCEPIRPMARHA
jgi:hypothetical protein